MRHVSIAALLGACVVAGPGQAQDIDLAHIEGLERDSLRSQVFAVDSARRVDIGGVKIARTRAGDATSAWILDSASRKVVWELDDAREFKHHGATCQFKGSVHLDPGTYEVYLATHPTQSGGGFGAWFRRVFRIGHDDLEEAAERLEIWVRGAGRSLGENSPERVHDLLAAEAFVTLACVGDGELRQQGFRLENGADVRIYAIGEVTSDGGFDAGWIVDAGSRRRVWSLDYWVSDHAGGARKNRLADTVIHLKAGDYAALYSTDTTHSCEHFNSAPPHDPFAWGLTLTVEDPTARDTASTFDYRDALDLKVIVRLDRVRDDEHRSEGFTLERPTEVLIHGLGEGADGEMYDYGWIVDARTRETVWEMRYRASEHAGGGEKNRVVQEVLSLPAGSYIVHYNSDGSHSYGDWNSAPPFEPERWGITVVAVGDTDTAKVVSEFDPDADPTVLASIRRVRDRAAERERFTVDSDSEVIVYALGEGSRGEMYDYGWIEDAESRSTVWQMEYQMTEHAGGAEKNRVFRGRLDLPAGSYVLRYLSDGSHAYRSWNQAPPHDPDSWGITVFEPEAPRHLEDPGSRP